MNRPLFLTPTEAAKILQVSPQHLARHADTLGALRLGRCVRYPSGVIHHLAEFGTLPQCPRSESRALPSTNAAKPRTASAGEKQENSTKNADTLPDLMLNSVPTRSDGVFAEAFPDLADRLPSAT